MYKERLVAGVVYAKYTLTVTKSGTGSGTVSATGCTLSWTGNTGTCTVDSGTQITLTATPDVGSTFDGWSNGTGSASGCSGTGICTFTITEDSGITATFTALTPTPTPTPTATPTPTPVSGGSIYGYVLDIKEEPVEGVKLKLKGLRTGYTAKEFSDEDGYFEFNDLEADTYRIIAKKRGYRQETKRVKLGEGESKEIEIVMRRTSRKTTLTEGVASTEGLR
jgi:hypothetical protein